MASQARTATKKKARAIDRTARIFTIGHSNHPISEFIELLQAHRLKLLVDVRKIPKSRHNPQYWGDKLAKSLGEAGIQYVYLPALAGRRPTHKDSINKGWRNTSFRGYADYMQTDEFKKGLKRLISLSNRKKLTVMCAEAVPWRCHRRLIADALLMEGHPVLDIYTKTSVKPHEMTPFAKVNRKKKVITYPPSKLTETPS